LGCSSFFAFAVVVFRLLPDGVEWDAAPGALDGALLKRVGQAVALLIVIRLVREVKACELAEVFEGHEVVRLGRFKLGRKFSDIDRPVLDPDVYIETATGSPNAFETRR
jgi:hypothetical protein